ncbi:MAG: hypothetical protein ABEJ78_08800 [Haloferacaceae archaeon]
MSLSDAADRLFLGRDPRLAVKLSSVAGVVFLLIALVHLPPRLVGSLSTPFGLFLPALFALMFALSIAGGYLNDGLLVCVALAGGPSLGFYLPLAIFDLAYPSETVLWALATGTGYAVVFGAAGFLVGAGGRRLVGRVRAAVSAA